MIERKISIDDILEAINYGETIATYTDDKPYPGFLFLKFVNTKPIHVVVAQNSEDDTCIIITCYHPDSNLWDADFKIKMK